MLCKKSLNFDPKLMHTATLSPSRSLIYSYYFSFSIAVKTQSSIVSLKDKEIHPFFAMASPSSSSSGLSVEGRISALETSMGRLRGRMDSQDKKLKEVSQAGDKTWDLLNEDIRKLREDHAASSERLEDFKDEVRTGFKDEVNTHGYFGK